VLLLVLFYFFVTVIVPLVHVELLFQRPEELRKRCTYTPHVCGGRIVSLWPKQELRCPVWSTDAERRRITHIVRTYPVATSVYIFVSGSGHKSSSFASPASRAIPKSINFTWHASVSSKLLGLTSRWAIERECKYSRASRI